jgi:hypothetical protein
VSQSRQAIELTIKAMFQTICTGLGDALAALPRWEKSFHIFWLLGPFILLIERNPSDIWLSFLAFAFVVCPIFKRDGAWLRVFWVRHVSYFWRFACCHQQCPQCRPMHFLKPLLGFTFFYLRWQ